ELPAAPGRLRRESPPADSAHFEIPPAIAAALNDVAVREGMTSFVVLLAAFGAWIHRLTGQEEFVIGAPVSDRDRTETEGLIGLFVQTIALRMDFRGDPTFRAVLERTRRLAFDVLAHREMPFEELVKAFQPHRALDRNPLFQVALAFQGAYPRRWPVGDLEATLIELESGAAKFDWTCILEHDGGQMRGRLEYRTDLFDAKGIAQFLGQFQRLPEGIVANPDRRISELPLLSEG